MERDTWKRWKGGKVCGGIKLGGVKWVKGTWVEGRVEEGKGRGSGMKRKAGRR